MNRDARILHDVLIARHGLREAAAIIADAHVLIDATVADQRQRHPEDWGPLKPPCVKK